MSVSTSVTEYKNFGKCVRIANGTVEAFVTVDVGPRIIAYNFIGGENIMWNDIERKACNQNRKYDEYYYPGAAWYNYGGHRMWISPESEPATYYPDNDPVAFELNECGAVFTPKPQTENGVQHSIQIQMSDAEAKMKVIHRVTNISGADKDFAIWGITVLNQNGLEIIPQNNDYTGLLPNRFFSVWCYTDLQDSRLYIGRDFVTLKQDTSVKNSFKLGMDNKAGTAVYANGDTVFINRYEQNHPNGHYADNGVSFETYTNRDILELETLGELKTVADGETSTHVEEWELCKNPGTPDARDEEAIKEFLEKVLK